MPATADSFQPIGAAAARVVASLEPRPLIFANGKFDPQAIASRVNDLWAAKQDFLAQYEGEPLRFWRNQIWNGIVEKVWIEADGAQTKWLLDNVKPIWLPSERLEYAALIEKQNSTPLGYDREFQELTWAKQRIANAAQSRAFDAAMPMQFRTRESALADVRMPGDEVAVAAE